MTDSKKNQVEPKFHEGEWVVLTAGELSTTLQIVKVDTNKRLYWFNDNSYLPIVDEECLHLWTIQDAKDGDVLYCKSGKTEFIVILKDISRNGNINSYCRYNSWCGFGVDIPNVMSISNNPKPAIKEQRDLLFQKMKEAGYEWDVELKKVSKITTPADVGFEELGKAWAEEANKQSLANSAKTCKKSQRMVSAEAKEALYDKPAWSDEDDVRLQACLDTLQAKSLMGVVDTKMTKWLKSIKQRIKGE